MTKPTPQTRRDLIKACGMTEKDLADALGVELHIVEGMITKECFAPNIDTLFKIANALGTDIKTVIAYWYFDEFVENVKIVQAKRKERD